MIRELAEMKVELGAVDRQVLEWSKQQNAEGPILAVDFLGVWSKVSMHLEKVCHPLTCRLKVSGQD
jgi:hypothetical protein